MADLTITAANVQQASDAEVEHGTAGATITAGQTVYKDTTDSDKWKLADNDDTAAKAEATGIALVNCADGQPISVIRRGDIDLGATLTVGEIYVLSSTAGGIAPEADLVTNDFVTVLGIATAADNLSFKPHVSGAQVP